MIQSYKKKYQLADSYDAIIIGTGMGSLTTGALLAKEGKRVLLLEKHYTAGGFTHVFKRKGYEWDVGIHYIGEVQRPNSPITKIFEYISNGNLKWADMGEVYDKIIIGEKEYNLVKGVENFKNQLKEYFPSEQNAIDQYVDHIFAANKAMTKFYAAKAIPVLLGKLLGNFMQKDYLKYADKTTYEVISSLTQNEDLIKVLTGQYGDYGLAPKKSSFVMHAAVVKHYFSGGSFPIGGSSQIVDTIAPVIAQNGGTILTNASVEEVIIKNNKAIGVKMADGKEFFAKTIISGAGVINTYKKLLPTAIAEKHKLLDKLQKVNPSVAHVSLYIGLNGSPEELELPKTNLWVYPGQHDHDTCVENYLNDLDSEFPVVYVSFPSAKDPDWSNRYPGKSTIDIITLVPYELFEPWKDSKWMKRGESYDDLKESIAQRLFEVLFKQLPYLKDKIDCYELSSPLSTSHFVNYDKGEIYGLDHTPERFRQKFLQPRTPIKGLYLTGQDIVTAGVGGALFAGLITASAITGKNFMKKIYKTY
ncbi:phytoene desaturase family protein [Urechidicola vernalis]|uniref:NAD(P)/FAD-dependent oxidoreductase n=1 Tax=Urechidicola vernalis TaxID=3075600 RepID=A0ABU2Y575_9FLAO|nr:NAD(P)/FAD-dependent oxidoreductase [Urechidicola sp. P050]MDT0552415.1 NAD(P)/FAD-dependent oxidoreductase [Urechidicola sp. P050]